MRTPAGSLGAMRASSAPSVATRLSTGKSVFFPSVWQAQNQLSRSQNGTCR